MNHYPRHVGDFATATVGLSLAERGAYSALIDQYYAHESPLPPNRSEVYRLAACTSSAERKAVDYVLGRYFTEQSDGWHQKRCDEELTAYRERSESARRSINARWSKRNTETDTNVIRTNSERNTSRKPVTSNQGKTKPAPEPSAPTGVRPEVWTEWQKLRGKKLTPYAVALQAKQLTAYGGDPNEIIEQSIRNGWAGLFALKRDGPSGGGVHAERARVAAEIWKGAELGNRDITGEVERIT